MANNIALLLGGLQTACSPFNLLCCIVGGILRILCKVQPVSCRRIDTD